MSDVTEILTGRIDLKRLTAYLTDGITPSFVNSLQRQPIRNSRLEVEISGGVIATGATVTFEGNGVLADQKYVLTDRISGIKWALQIYQGAYSISETVETAQQDIIVQDSLDSGVYWSVFIEDGFIKNELSVVHRDDSIILLDQFDLASGYKISVGGGILGLITNSLTVESLFFPTNGIEVTVSDFNSVGRITVSGVVGGSMYIRAINGMGQPINQQVLVAQNLPVRFYAQSGRIRMLKQGQDKIAKYKIMTEPDTDIRDNDLVYTLSGCFGLTYGQINFVEKFYDFDGITHHTEAEIVDL